MYWEKADRIIGLPRQAFLLMKVEKHAFSLKPQTTATGIENGTIVTLREEERIKTSAGSIDVVPAWRWFLE